MSNFRIVQRGRVSSFSTWPELLDAWRYRVWPWWRNAPWFVDVALDAILDE